MRIERFRAAHLADLELQDAQAYFSAQMTSAEYGAMLEQAGQSFTGFAGGRVIGCAGVTEVWTGRFVAWALIAKDAGRHMVALHRAVAGFLSTLRAGRIELWVDEGFAPGMRWAEMLGFSCETPQPMRNFRPGGGACFLFSRVQ